jgi:hypothetical protein
LFNYRFPDPEIRKRIHRGWVDAVYKHYGKDTGAAGYRRSINNLTKELKANIKFGGDLMEIFSLLVDRLETQENLTKQCFDRLKSLSKEDLHKKQYEGMMIEGAIKALKKKPNGRKIIINFLISPLTDGSVDTTYEYIAAETNEIRETTFYTESNLPFSVKIPPDRAKAELRLLWEDFWAAPFLIRAGLFEYLLFPIGEITPANYQEAFDLVNTHLFPLDEQYSDEARKFVSAYFTVTPSYQHRIMLAAMMVTAEKSHEQVLTIGERLAAVLELLGPAETKLGQVIHSHPRTPMEIKSGMGKLKSKASPPYRWDLFENYRQCVPLNVRQQVVHLGKLLGSASFFLAFEATMKLPGKGRRLKKTRGVFKILRPHAQRRAEDGFTTMLRMLNPLELDQSVIDILGQMITQARNNARIETNHEIGTRQTQIATYLYDRRTVTINNEPFFIHVPKVLHHGSDPESGHYQFIELAPGNHFNDLKDKTPEERSYKKKLAIAYYAFEINNILQGNRFDSDRHGAQLRIRDNDFYLFDWGNMLLDTPSEEQLRQLGSSLVDVFVNIMQGAPISDGLASVLDRLTSEGVDISFLLEVQKALLALEDFRKHISQKELITILTTAMQNNPHEAIAGAVFGRAMELELDMGTLESFMGSTEEPSLEIIISAPIHPPIRKRRHRKNRQRHKRRNNPVLHSKSLRKSKWGLRRLGSWRHKHEMES